MQMTPPTALSTPSNSAGGRPPLGGGGDAVADAMNAATATAAGPSGSSALEITYSTISPKVEQPQQPPPAAAYPMHIKLSLIDQNPRPSNLLGSNGCASAGCLAVLMTHTHTDALCVCVTMTVTMQRVVVVREPVPNDTHDAHDARRRVVVVLGR